MGDVAPTPLPVAPPVELAHVARYDEMSRPPSSPGAVNATLTADVDAAVATGESGASGTVTTSKADVAADAADGPSPLVATTVQV